MAYAPSMTPYFDWKPCPRVEVLFTAFAAGTATVTVYRTAGGRESRVRGGINAATAGGLSRIDMEVPFNGIPVIYRAEMFNSAGVSLGFTDSATLTMSVVESCLHNPLDPNGAVPIVMADTAAKSISRPVPGSVVYPQGRRVGVVISGTRQGITGINLDCYTQSDADTDKVAAMVGTYSSDASPVLCFRLGVGMKMRIPQPFFAAVLDPREEEADLHLGGEFMVWRMTGDEVAPPAPGLFIPLLTNADLNAFYLTNAALNADNLTNLAVNRRYDLIGAA